jgi:hypothetical protein
MRHRMLLLAFVMLLLFQSTAAMYCEPKNCYAILGLPPPSDTGNYVKTCSNDAEEEYMGGAGHMADLSHPDQKLICTEEEQTAYSAEQKAIKKAYRNLAMVWHPDKNRSPGAKIEQINAAPRLPLLHIS